MGIYGDIVLVNDNDPDDILHIKHIHWGYGDGVETVETAEGIWLRDMHDGRYYDANDVLYCSE